MFKGRTGTTYDGLDRVVETKQGTTVTSRQTSTRVLNTHDSLGRRLRTEAPDSGAWQYQGHGKVADGASIAASRRRRLPFFPS